MPMLRDPDLDPDERLDPEQLIAMERTAEPERQALEHLPEPARRAVGDWLRAECAVARERALAVGDQDFVECIAAVERRLIDPGCYLRDAEANAKIQQVLRARAGLYLVPST